MQQAEPKLEKDVTDYDFLFSNGNKLPITLDLELGDTVQELKDRYVVFLAAKPRVSNPELTMPAETATVFKSGLLATIVRERKQRLPTPEEQFEMKLTMNKLIGKLPEQEM